MSESHEMYVAAAYLATAAIAIGLVLWVVLDARVQRRLLTELEARGVRRRSADGTAARGESENGRK